MGDDAAHPSLQLWEAHPVPIPSFRGNLHQNGELRGVVSPPPQLPTLALQKYSVPFGSSSVNSSSPGTLSQARSFLRKLFQVGSCIYTGARLRIIEELDLPQRPSSWKSPPTPRPILTPRVMFRAWRCSSGAVEEEEEGEEGCFGPAEPQAAARSWSSAPRLGLPAVSCSQKRYLMTCVFVPDQRWVLATRPSQALPVPSSSSLSCP